LPVAGRIERAGLGDRGQAILNEFCRPARRGPTLSRCLQSTLTCGRRGRLREFSTSCPRIIDKAIDTQSFLLLLEHSIGRQWSVMDWSGSQFVQIVGRSHVHYVCTEKSNKIARKPTSAISSRRACSSGNALRLSIAIPPKTQFAYLEYLRPIAESMAPR
jgi:hypothetical protein